MLEWLEKLTSSKKLILVEGEKDLSALKNLGVKNIVAISRRPLYKVIEELSGENEVVILTDLDRTGRKLYSRIKKGLQNNGVKIDTNFREYLMKNTRLTNIEGITSYLQKHHGI